ncbi:hypothetical protein EVAR_67134_1 [Eumeta japonica]|uniref:Uncharacterized protein n=1 Tax=Eumeta variegata TaxID=151549 RepID=A0A4C1ZY35_EUMVA|nr:hypothetical protein EVAR_67134_1 [Eumeta japonica]
MNLAKDDLLRVQLVFVKDQDYIVRDLKQWLAFRDLAVSGFRSKLMRDHLRCVRRRPRSRRPLTPSLTPTYRFNESVNPERR